MPLLRARRAVDFLDAGPPEPADWTLVGCERSRQIHVALYGREPAARVDFCPRADARPATAPTLLKCCLLERGIERDGARWSCRGARAWRRSAGALRELAGL